jgi:hypothetical protein
MAAAIERVVTDSYGIEREKVGSAALRLLGFKRVTEAGEDKVDKPSSCCCLRDG